MSSNEVKIQKSDTHPEIPFELPYPDFGHSSINLIQQAECAFKAGDFRQADLLTYKAKVMKAQELGLLPENHLKPAEVIMMIEDMHRQERARVAEATKHAREAERAAERRNRCRQALGRVSMPSVDSAGSAQVASTNTTSEAFKPAPTAYTGPTAEEMAADFVAARETALTQGLADGHNDDQPTYS